MRKWKGLGALLVPIALATVSIAPAALLPRQLDLIAYRSLGYESHSRSFWGVPTRYEGNVRLERFDERSLSVTPVDEIRMIGAGFAGDGWSIEYEYQTLFARTTLPATFSFVRNEADDAVGSGVTGLRLMAGRDATGAPTPFDLMAVGVTAPFSLVAFSPGRHRLAVSFDGSMATVTVDGREVWTGDPGWTSFEGFYPILDLPPGEQLVSVVPDVDVEFAFGGGKSQEDFQRSFTAAALEHQASTGRFSADSEADAWAALALIMDHRRNGDEAVAAALDRWADGRFADARAGRAWPGLPGPLSIEANVGAPGLALALWGRDRGRDDWLGTVTDMIEAAGFTPCANAVLDWCRLGNLQPDGRVAHGEDPEATRSIASFQVAETAAFVAGARPEDRRDWIRSLVQRTYSRLPCQSAINLARARGIVDERPWTVEARRNNGFVLFMLGLAYSARPDDPVWGEAPVVESLRCRLNLLRTQVVGPMGWRDKDGIAADVMLCGAEAAASRLLAPITQVAIDDERFQRAWERLTDPSTGQLLVRADDSATVQAEAAARAVVLIAILGS